MNTWVQVDKLQDQEPVNAETLNRPVDQLASRTEYLKKRIGNILEDGVQSSLVIPDVDLIADDSSSFKIGNVVYRMGDGFHKAQAKMHLNDDFTAADSAFTLGILVSVTGSKGDVLIYGKMDMSVDSQLTKSAMLQSGETFRSGRYYLSAIEPGKLTANPDGPLIYVGSFFSETTTGDTFSAEAMACINPQFLDMGTSHVHRAYPLVARPAGSVYSEEVIGYLPIEAVESSSVSSDSSSEEESRSTYPSIIFGGTWTSDENVAYTFKLSGRTWGNIKLTWYKNGHDSQYKEVTIPASNVFVDLDNGLKAKMQFPQATGAMARPSEEQLTWNLTFPLAGRGWVSHSVDAIASIVNDDSESSSSDDESVNSPAPHAIITGSWLTGETAVSVYFPTSVRWTDFDDTCTGVRVQNSGTDYDYYAFVSEGDSYSGTTDDTVINVVKGGTIDETLRNLTEVANERYGTPCLFSYKNTLLVCNRGSSGGTSGSWNTTYMKSTGYNVISTKDSFPAIIFYNEDDFTLLGPIQTSKHGYVPIYLDNLTASIYATDATAANNCVIYPETRLHAEAYDYAPQAKYDYMMGLHQEVDYYFPPVPAQAAGLFVNGVEVENSSLFPEHPTYIIGHDTLHWLTDEEGKRPWPTNIKSHDDYVDPSLDKTMAFYFIVGFQCASGPVTSIVPAPDSPIKLYTYGTKDTAYTGDLMIDADLDLSVSDGGVQGYNVAKEGKGGKLLAGPVVERIKAGNGIIVTQQAGAPEGQGTVTIGLDDGTVRNHFNEIALENAKQEKIGLFPYVSLLGWGESGNIPSAFTAMMRVPTNLEDKSYQLQLRMVMFGTTSYTGTTQRAAGVQLEYNILPDYTDKTSKSLKTGLLIPDSPRQIAVPFGHQVNSEWVYTAYDPFVATTEVTSEEAESDVRVPFSELPLPSPIEFSQTIPDLRPGYLLAIRVSRTSVPSSEDTSYDAYTSPIGFISMEWTLEEA